MGESKRLVAATLVAAVIAGGCAATTYRIPDRELARLAQTDPAARGQSVAVRQDVPWEDEPPGAQPVGADAQLVIVTPIHIDGTHGGGYHGGRPIGGGGGGIKGSDGKAGDAKSTAIAIVAIAAAAVVLLAVTEGQRFAGDVRVHPMHPVHLFLRDGRYAVVPLAQIDPQLASFTDRAVIRATEGPWETLRRAPLERTGLTYSVLLGAASSVSADGRLGVGPTAHLQVGIFPDHRIGLLADLVFGWRDNAVDRTLFDTRGALELQAWPVVMGPLHGGLFGNLGIAQRIEDGIPRGNSRDLAFSGGAQLQLDLTTFLGLTARFGLTRAHGDMTREVLVGLSVY
jgi:hypothetical protein